MLNKIKSFIFILLVFILNKEILCTDFYYEQVDKKFFPKAVGTPIEIVTNHVDFNPLLVPQYEEDSEDEAGIEEIHSVADRLLDEEDFEEAGIEERRWQIEDKNVWPYRLCGNIITDVDCSSKITGSGVLIGPRHFLTAAHNLHRKEEERKAHSIKVVFPVCSVKAIGYFLYRDWMSSPKDSSIGFEKDIALVVLRHPVGNDIGWSGIVALEDADLSDKLVEITGYPLEKRGSQIWTMITRNLTTQGDERLLYTDIQTSHGQSGGWIRLVEGVFDNRIIGIHTRKNKGVRISKTKLTHLINSIHLSREVEEVEIPNELSLGINEIVSCCYSKNCHWFAASVHEKIFLHDCSSSGWPHRELRQHTDRITSLVFSPKEENILLSGGLDGKVIKWNCRGGVGECVKLFDCPREVRSIVFTSSEEFAASGWNSPKSIIYICSVKDDIILDRKELENNVSVWCLASPAENEILYGTNGGTFGMISMGVHSPLPREKGHEGVIKCLAFHHKGKFFVSGGGERDKKIKVWEKKTSNVLLRNTLEHHDGAILSIAFHPKGNFFVSSSEDKNIVFWDHTASIAFICRYPVADAVRKVAVSPDGQFLALYSISNGIITLINLNTIPELSLFLREN